MIVRIPLIESMSGLHNQQSLNDSLQDCIGLIPDDLDMVNARLLHNFLAVAEAYDLWITKMIAVLRMKMDRDFRWRRLEQPSQHNNSDTRETGSWDIYVTTQMVKYLARLESTPRSLIVGQSYFTRQSWPNPEPLPRRS